MFEANKENFNCFPWMKPESEEKEFFVIFRQAFISMCTKAIQKHTKIKDINTNQNLNIKILHTCYSIDFLDCFAKIQV